MAEFLTTNAASYRLEQIIKNAKEKLVLVSPFVQISTNHLRNLKAADNKAVKITLIYREGELESEEKAKLDTLKNLSLYCHPNLHAKCYYNENQLIITSMNLYEFSEKKNPEMGVLVQKEDDNSIYSEAVSEVESILGSPETKREAKGVLAVFGRGVKQGLKDISKSLKGTPSEGYCIRCGQVKEYNPDRPLCLNDFVKWNEYKDIDYPENFCHRCGKTRKVSMDKPLCRACYIQANG